MPPIEFKLPNDRPFDPKFVRFVTAVGIGILAGLFFGSFIVGIIAFAIFAGGKKKKLKVKNHDPLSALKAMMTVQNTETGKTVHLPMRHEDPLGEREERKKQLRAIGALVLAIGLSVGLFMFLTHKDMIFGAVKEITEEIRIEMADPESEL